MLHCDSKNYMAQLCTYYEIRQSFIEWWAEEKKSDNIRVVPVPSFFTGYNCPQQLYIFKVWSFSSCLSTTCLWLLSNNFISDPDKNEMLVFLKSWPASTCFLSIFNFKRGGQKLSKCMISFPQEQLLTVNN